MITNPTEEAGAGITPKEGQWKNVESIFPLHDQKFNREWIKNWSTTTFLGAEDLDAIRDHLGEKVSCRSTFHDILLLTFTGDCFLFRLYTILLRLLDLPCGFWVFCLGSPRPLLAGIRCR